MKNQRKRTICGIVRLGRNTKLNMYNDSNPRKDCVKIHVEVMNYYYHSKKEDHNQILISSLTLELKEHYLPLGAPFIWTSPIEFK